ncbi:MAG: Lipoprotein signal peptidase [uncultured bacterium]|uniref:Lipoprotein signal peptidase n=1 Tax=Candidatus Magasanikbacteria bacterium GW2011_GWA2_42_32 TaxID=1619039 RepID=A0A0G1A7T9_9BACT|nr:MAG: Lipoprotein signal peptidase [uncultured bacterium]KKR48551.1 MAG: Lipoprotein signal peptidase [Candidatus Magasanikbacteria bacterium GW2011_GWC2_40_17]KKS57095.1 MAG: Lipoprotein signal peptidase [Candidatus Magasanikbacteria bacterium GW2011_GWA2_42_32]OGH85381.1 MAG: hypothetical protein A2294_01290 [Candidatus Magasanikbacteria bacterium RIFOXYB2_FULL_38_10]
MKKYFYLIFLFLADIILKQIALRDAEGFFIIPRIFAFYFFKNSALAFSIKFPQSVIVIFSILILMGLLFFVWQKPCFFFPITLIILGAISNLFDRISYGYVVDYFYLFPVSYFNLADLLIFSGLILLIIKLYRHKQKKI